MGVPYDERFCRPYGLEGLFHRPVYSLRGFQDPDSAFTGLARKIADKIDAETRLLAAIAYGEASTADLEDEVAGIACIDTAVSAQVRPLKHRPRRVSSCPAPGVVAGGCKS